MPFPCSIRFPQVELKGLATAGRLHSPQPHIHGYRSALQKEEKVLFKEEEKGEKKSNKYPIIFSVYYAKFGMKSLSHINVKVTYLFIKFSSVYIIMLIVFLILNVLRACQTH